MPRCFKVLTLTHILGTKVVIENRVIKGKAVTLLQFLRPSTEVVVFLTVVIGSILSHNLYLS